MLDEVARVLPKDAIGLATDFLQTVLGILGVVPGLGAAADLIDVAISAARGDGWGFGFGALGLVPLFGDALVGPLGVGAVKIPRAMGAIDSLMDTVDDLGTLLELLKQLIDRILSGPRYLRDLCGQAWGKLKKFGSDLKDRIAKMSKKGDGAGKGKGGKGVGDSGATSPNGTTTPDGTTTPGGDKTPDNGGGKPDGGGDGGNNASNDTTKPAPITAPIDFDGHIFNAEVKPNGAVVGGHSTATGQVVVVRGTETAPNSKGVYKAIIEVADPNNPGRCLRKTNNGGWSTLFPDSWSVDRVKSEVEAAFKSKTVTGNKWSGTTPSGVKVEGYIHPNTTVYPIF